MSAASQEEVTDSSTPRAFFNTLGTKYEDAFGHDEGLRNFVHSSLDLLLRNGSILDIGSGTGKLTAQATVERRFQLHGIEISSTMVKLAQAQVPGASFELCDVLKYQPQPDVSFDGIVALLSHFWMDRDEVAALISGCREWLKPGGMLFIGTVVADDLVPAGDFDLDSAFVDGIPFALMGESFDQLYFTRKGWDALLMEGGFEVLGTDVVPFRPPVESRCDPEPHYYIVARKLRAIWTGFRLISECGIRKLWLSWKSSSSLLLTF